MNKETTRQRGPQRRVPVAIGLALVLVLSVVIAACGGGGSSSGSTESETSSGGESTEASSGSTEPIVLAGLEGEVAEGGPDFMKGMEIGVEELNKEGGVNGREVRAENLQNRWYAAGRRRRLPAGGC